MLVLTPWEGEQNIYANAPGSSGKDLLTCNWPRILTPYFDPVF